MRFAAVLFLTLAACESDPGEAPPSLPCELSVDGVAKEARLSGWLAEAQPDGGAILSASGTADGETLSFSIDIAGGTEVDFQEGEGSEPTATLPVGGSAVNVRLVLGETVYRGTEGALLFSAYGIDPGDRLTGTFEIGLMGIVLPRTTARIRADFQADVVVP